MADKEAKEAKAKGRKGGKSGGKDKGKSKEAAAPYTSIATHPRAAASVRRAKGWGGLAGFAVAALLSLKAGVPFAQACERSLIFGIVGFLLAWALSVFVWRQLMIAEQRAAIAEIERRREAARVENESNERGRSSRKPTAAASGSTS